MLALSKRSTVREVYGTSSIIPGLVVAMMMIALVAGVVVLPKLVGNSTYGEIQRSEEMLAKQKEDLSVSIISTTENLVVLRAVNTGTVPVTVLGVVRHLDGALETVQMENLEIYPLETREFSVSMVYDGAGLLSARGNIFAADGSSFDGIEVLVLDLDTDEPVENAIVTGAIHSSNTIPVNARTNSRGLTVLSLDTSTGHTYSLLADAVGYEENSVTGEITRTDGRHIVARIKYDPFDLELAENSASISRPYTSYSYSGGTTSESYTAQRTVVVKDSRGNIVYDNSTSVNYAWEELVPTTTTQTKTLASTASTASYTTAGWTVTANYTTENYVSSYKTETYQEWVAGHYETKTRQVSKTRTDSVSLSANTSTLVRSIYAVLGYTVTANYTAESYTATETYISGWTTIKIGSLTLPLPIYSTRQVTKTRQVLSGYTASKEVSYTETESYQEWVAGHYETKTRSVPVYSTRQTLSGYTATKSTTTDTWQSKSSTSRPSWWMDSLTITSSTIRNPVKTTTVTQTPRTKVETYTAYRNYSVSGTGYTFLSWENEQVEVRVVPKNGYENIAALVASTDASVSVSLNSDNLSLAPPASTSSPATTTLNISLSHASGHTVWVNGYDSNGRFVDNDNIYLEASESLPSGSSSRTLLGTSTMSSESATPVVTVSTTSPGVVTPVTPVVLPAPIGNSSPTVVCDQGSVSSFYASSGTTWINETGSYLVSGGSIHASPTGVTGTAGATLIQVAGSPFGSTTTITLPSGYK